MRFLCASNLHLRRRISGIPGHLLIDPHRLSTSAAWEHLVETAVRQEVDAVLLGGNVIDRENRQFEPLGPLEQGMTTLHEHDIPVIALSGNHDVDTLGRFASRIGDDAFQVLDADRWDRVTVNNTGTVIGRSAWGSNGSSSLLAGMPGKSNEPTVVLLHASLTDGHAPEHTFQPIRIADIEESPFSLWILGHQREPDMMRAGNTVVIEPGAICPSGPAETGPHGVWIVDTNDAANSRLLPVSPVQFEDVDIDLSTTGSLEEIENTIIRSLHATLAHVVQADALGHLICVLCAVHLTGSTDHHHELPELTRALASTINIQRQGVAVAITSIDIDTRPDIELSPLLGRADPVGELARLLTSLDADDPSPAHDALIQRTVNRLQAVHRARVFASVADDPEPDVEDARTILRRESWNVLDALVRQRGVE